MGPQKTSQPASAGFIVLCSTDLCEQLMRILSHHEKEQNVAESAVLNRIAGYYSYSYHGCSPEQHVVTQTNNQFHTKLYRCEARCFIIREAKMQLLLVSIEAKRSIDQKRLDMQHNTNYWSLHDFEGERLS